MKPRVIAFFSTKGGVGKTLISLNLSVRLSLEKKRTILLDFDLSAPQATSRLLGQEVKYSLFHIIEHLDEFAKGKRDISNYLLQYNQYLEYFPSILRMSQRTAIKPDVINKFLSIIEGKYDFIIIDAGSNLTDNLITIFEHCNLIFLMLTPDILTVYQTQWLLDTLQEIGFPLNMVRIILNRAESKGSISGQELRVVIPAQIISFIPSDGKIVGTSVNKGIPFVIDAPSSKIASTVNSLAQEIITKEDLYVDHKTLEDIRIAKEEFAPQETFWEKIGLLTTRYDRVALQEEEDKIIKFKKRVHERLLEKLDLKRLPLEMYTSSEEKMQELRMKAERIVADVISEEVGGFISARDVRAKITKEIVEEALGLGPLEDLLRDPTVTEIMVNNKDQVYVERFGKIELTSRKFTSNEQVKIVIERILAPLGRRIDESNPYVDARLPDGSRVNAIIAPLSLTGPTLTIRKFSKERYTMDDLINKFGSLTPEMAQFLQAAVVARKNILISGGTGSGKTTMLNILSSFIPEDERIITIEDAAELKLHQTHWVRLESRPPNIEGRGEVSIRDLFRNSLRMRPDRIIVGEVRGREVLDMLQAMNTGHDGSMSTIHANSTHDVLIRLDSMILMSGIDLPIRAIREQIASALHLIVHTARLSDGSRKVVAITEVVGMLDEMHINLQDIFIFRQTGVDKEKKVVGYFTPLGYIPTFYDEIRAKGIDLSREIFIAKY